MGKNKKKLEKPRHSKSSSFRRNLVIFSWLTGMCWVFVSNLTLSKDLVDQQTFKNLLRTKTVVNYFMEEYQLTPLNMNMIRAYAKSLNYPVSPFDSYAQRLDYIRLSSEHFVIRSFGKDGRQNTQLNNQDLITGVLIKRPENGYIYDYLTRDKPQAYDPTAILGLESPNRIWYARLYADPITNKTHIVVRHRYKKNLYMVALHDRVEEFLWLPSSNHIVFSATSSDVYGDGLYLWDIGKDRLTNLTQNIAKNQNFSHLSKSDVQLHISLAGVGKTEDKVFAFIAQDKNVPLDPKDFYAPQMLLNLQIDIKTQGVEVAKNSSADHLQKEDFWKNIHQHKILGAKGTKVQRTWRQLPLRGEKSIVLDHWQNFIKSYSTSPITPYALWYLSLLYNDAYQKEESPQAANTLRSLGGEITGSLTSFTTAPSYLRAMSAFLHQNLSEGTKLDLHFRLNP